MEKYTIYCTQEQTLKAIELGAPIEGIFIPTAEQMIGWLEEHEEIDEIAPMEKGGDWVYVVYMTGYRSDIESPKDTLYPARPEATLAAIDAALDYLVKNKK